VFEVARQHQGIFASGGVARQINTFVIVQNLFAVTEMKEITGHGEMIRRRKLQLWTPASNTAEITIIWAMSCDAPKRPQPAPSYCTAAEGLARLCRPAIRLNLGDNAGVQTIALLNIHMIDVRSPN
jgi:hypothetical protein